MLCPLCQSDNSAQSTRCRACGAPLKSGATDAATAPDALPQGTLLIGTYAVEEVLGQGGFGITYRCHDRMLDRAVAIKEFFPSGCRRQNAEVQAARGLSGDSFREARAQFLSEARVLARCHHVGIVGVHAAFEANSTAYMVMELLSGKTLAQLLTARGGAMNEAEAVGIIERVGEALQFVHEQNLLHRDIKPDNIIVCDDGRVMLIDFGTARETIPDQVQGQTVVVTPGYAPLEQYAKQARRGPFTDVYSLSATLYQLLSGQMPPAASDRAMGVQLRGVREFKPQISPAVAAAVESALQMEIARRPQSVGEFLELLHAPVDDSDSEVAAKLKLLVGRPNLLHSTDPEVEALFSPRSAQSPVDDVDDEIPSAMRPDAIRARQAAWQFERARGNAQPVKLAPLAPTSTTVPAPANYNPASGGIQVQVDNETNNSGCWWFWVFIAFAGFLALLNSGGSQRRATSSSYRSPVITQPVRPSSSRDNSYRNQTNSENSKRQEAQKMWDALPVLLPVSVEMLPDGKKDATSRYTEWRSAVQFSPDGKRLAYIDNQAVLQVLSMPERKLVRSLALDPKRVWFDTMISPDNQTIAAFERTKDGTQTNRVSVWSVRTGKLLGVFSVDAKKESLWAQALLNDGQLLVRRTLSASSTSNLFLWNSKTGKRSKSPIEAPKYADWGYGVVSPDGKEFALGDDIGGLSWIDLKTGKQKASRIVPKTGAEFTRVFGESSSTYYANHRLNVPLAVRGIDYSLNGNYIASRNDGEIRVFDEKFRPIGALSIDNKNGMWFSVAPDGKWVAAHGALPYSPDGNILWNIQNDRKLRLEAPSQTLGDFSFSPDGKQLYGVFADDKKFQLVTWEVGASPVDATPAMGFANPQTTSFQLFETRVASWTRIVQSDQLIALPVGGSVHIRRLDGQLVRTLNVGDSNVEPLLFSPDGQKLAVRRQDNIIQIWDVSSARELAQLPAGTSPPQNELDALGYSVRGRNVAFSFDNKYFAYARLSGSSSSVELWSLQGQPRRLASLAQKEAPTALGFSADGKTLAFGSKIGAVQLVDVATRQVKSRLQAQGPVIGIIGAPEKWVVVGASQTAVYQFSASNPQPKYVSQFKMPINPSPRNGLHWAVSGDGKLLAVSGRDAPTGAPTLICDLASQTILQTLREEPEQVRANSFPECYGLNFSSDGSRLIRLSVPFTGDRILTTTYRRQQNK